METPQTKPTSQETSLAQREQMVALAAGGWTRRAIAVEVGCSPRTVQRWLRRARAAGSAGLAYRSRRPRRPHPQTTAPAIVARIDAVRRAHPGWGARLIRRQLVLDGLAGIPSEVTVQAWLRRLGHAPVQPPRHKPLGWSTPPVAPSEAVWQADFKAKGGSRI